MRVSLGKHGILTTEEARREAKTKLAELAHGANPNALKKEDRLRLTTLQEVYNDYLAGRDLKPKTIKDYNNCLRLYLSDWLNTPVIHITRDQIEARHREISSRGEAAANLTMRLLRSMSELRCDPDISPGDESSRLPLLRSYSKT